MDMCVTLAALLLALVPLTLTVDLNHRRQIKYNVAPVKCKLKGKEVKLQRQNGKVCDPVAASIPSGYNKNVHSRFSVSVQRKNNRIKMTWTFSKKVNRFVIKPDSSSRPCYLVTVPSYAQKMKKKQRQLTCTHRKNVNYTIVPVDRNLNPTDTPRVTFIPDISTTPPMGCYNWHPDTFTLRQHDDDVTVTWSPAFKKSGLHVYLYNINADEVVDERMFASYEMLDNPVTEYTIRHVTEGLYEARIKPTGCNDCPDSFDGCHSQPQATEPVNITTPVMAADPVNITTPVMAADPVNITTPVMAADPVNITTPVMAADPVNIITPVMAADPVNITTPVMAADPVNITTPVMAADPVNITTPVMAADPVNITTPVMAADPVNITTPVIEISTKSPMGCYNWHPDTFTLRQHDDDVTVTWSPAFKKSGLHVYLYNINADEVADEKSFASYKMLDNPVTEYTFHNVREGLYEARIKPTGCNDCPDQFDGCHPQPLATDPVNITTPVIGMGCYDWHPDTFTLRPHNGSVTVTWSPAFRKSGLQVYLYNTNADEIADEKLFASYEMLDNPVTEYTFHNVRGGLYEARIKPTGCTDCPDKFAGCYPQPQATDEVKIIWSTVTDEEQQDGIVWFTKKPVIHHSANVLPIYILAGVSSVAFTAVIIMAAACLRKGYSPKTKSIPYKLTHGYKSSPGPNIQYVRVPDDEVLRPRIVILYGVDHHYHITAVMSFARLLRKVLDVEVVVEREQSRDSICNISEWLTQTLRPPTTIIVVASEALYQLCCHQNNHCISRLSGDMFAMYGPVALSYLHQQSFSIQPFPQEVLLVSFGYGHGDNSSSKLEDSFRLLFGDRHFEATLKLSDETRSENIRDLLRCLTLNGSVPDAGDVVSEVDEFLADVEQMDEHIREHGPAWWENIADSFSYTTETSIAGPNPRLGLDINNETFSVSSEVTASSIVTVNVLCKRCRASSCMTLPNRPSEITREARSLSERRHAVSESSCLTLYMPDGDAENINDVFTSDTTGVSENTTPLQIEDIEYVAETEIPNSAFNQVDSIESLDSVVIGGRDCL